MIKINYSNLKYPPIPAKKLPKFLIYEHPIENKYGNKYCTITSTNDGKMYGELEYKKDHYWGPAIFLDNFELKIKHKNLAAAILNRMRDKKIKENVVMAIFDFIKNKSIKDCNGRCNGRFFLMTSESDDKKFLYPFYLRFGMMTNNPQFGKMLEKCNRKDIPNNLQSMLFYYEPEVAEKVIARANKQKRNTILDILSKFFSKTISQRYNLELNLQ